MKILRCVDRAHYGNLLRVIIARSHLPFFKIFSNFVHFCPNFQIFCPFLTFFFCPYSEKSHACPYFLEWALVEVYQFKRLKNQINLAFLGKFQGSESESFRTNIFQCFLRSTLLMLVFYAMLFSGILSYI